VRRSAHSLPRALAAGRAAPPFPAREPPDRGRRRLLGWRGHHIAAALQDTSGQDTSAPPGAPCGERWAALVRGCLSAAVSTAAYRGAVGVQTAGIRW
jgi:hypothetical protein